MIVKFTTDGVKHTIKVDEVWQPNNGYPELRMWDDCYCLKNLSYIQVFTKDTDGKGIIKEYHIKGIKEDEAMKIGDELSNLLANEALV